MRAIRIAGNLLGPVTVAVALFAFGCLLAVPVAIQYYQSTREYVATAEVGSTPKPSIALPSR